MVSPDRENRKFPEKTECDESRVPSCVTRHASIDPSRTPRVGRSVVTAARRKIDDSRRLLRGEHHATKIPRRRECRPTRDDRIAHLSCHRRVGLASTLLACRAATYRCSIHVEKLSASDLSTSASVIAGSNPCRCNFLKNTSAADLPTLALQGKPLAGEAALPRWAQ